MTGDPTTLVLVRHGVTDHTTGQRFSGGLAGSDPGLSEAGRAQVRSVGEWLAPAIDRIDAVVTSPVRRTRESAQVLGELFGHQVEEEPGLAEMEFGAWDGLTFPEVAEQHQDDLDAWLGAVDVAPGGTGESFLAVEERVLAARDRLLAAHAGRTVVVVSHVTPIKTLVADALGAPLLALFRMELAPASVTVVTYLPPDQPGPPAVLRLLNAVAPDRGPLGDPTRW